MQRTARDDIPLLANVDAARSRIPPDPHIGQDSFAGIDTINARPMLLRSIRLFPNRLQLGDHFEVFRRASRHA